MTSESSDDISSFDDAGDGAAPTQQRPSPSKSKSPQKLPLVILPRRASVFPFFLENVAITGAVAFNKSWDPLSWSDCKRGRFYTGKGDSGKGEALLVDLVKEVRFLADKGNFRSVDLIVKGDNLNNLTSDATQKIELAFWDGEFDGSSAVQLVKALCPDPAENVVDKAESVKLTKKQAIASLVTHRIPLMVFDDMEALVRAVRSGSYLLKSSLDDCARDFLKTYVLCNSAELETGISKRKGPGAEHLDPSETMMSKDAVIAETLRLKLLFEDSERSLARELMESKSKHARDPDLDKALASMAEYKKKLAVVNAQRRSIEADRGLMGPPEAPPFKRVPLDLQTLFPVVPSAVLADGQEGAFRFLSAFGSTLTDSLSRALGGRHLGGLPEATGTALTPYAKRLVYLDKLLVERGFIPFVEFANEAMKDLEMRLPSSKSKSVKVVGNQLCFTDDESFGDMESAHNMGHWKQGFHFVLARMLKHEDPLVCDPDIIQDRMAFFQMVNELKIDDGAFKLKTVNEFLRRVGASKSFLWMPEVVVHQLMFAGAYHEATEAAAKKRKFNDGGAPNITKKQKWEAKKKNKGGGGLQSGYQGKDSNKLVESSADERKANGVCPSRASKTGSCPCKGPPKFCKYTHECPRHSGEFHPASQCNKM